MPRPANNREEIRSKLRIDEEDFDRCLVEHSEYFEKAATEAVEAKARHAALKLELVELSAQLDQDIRAKNAREDIKMSETGLSNTIKLLPKVKDLTRRLYAAERDMDECIVLKESFQQRSYLLREINQRQIARMYNLSVERGTAGARRNAVGDVNRAELERRSLERRVERYRPSAQDE
jgi:hypothetical protein